MPFPVPNPNQVIKDAFDRKWRDAFISLLTIFLIILVSGYWYLSTLRSERDNCRLEKTNLESGIKSQKDKIAECNVMGSQIEPVSTVEQNVDDFKRDWDTSDFYLRGENEFCPKSKGGRNYQRMFYRPGSMLVGSKLHLKFEIVDEKGEDVSYIQRVVVGIGEREKLVSEFDIPTRYGQTVNFREASSAGSLVSVQKGQSLPSPIREGSVINLGFESNQKLGSEITEVIHFEYPSVIPEYGDQDKSLSYDLNVGDSHPETAPTTLFIGSYIGGCIQIINWQVT
jgi:hypothetical protein